MFLNGKSLGTKQRNTEAFLAAGLNWDLSFKEGENTLVSIGKNKDSKEVKDELKLNYRYTKNEKQKV